MEPSDMDDMIENINDYDFSSLEELDDGLDEDNYNYNNIQLCLRYFSINDDNNYIHLVMNDTHYGRNNTVITFKLDKYCSGIKLSENLYNELKSYSQIIDREVFNLYIKKLNNEVILRTPVDLATLYSINPNTHYVGGKNYICKLLEFQTTADIQQIIEQDSNQIIFRYE